jgi:serine phosphatase RsbU (regulator of sigma subunit)
VRYTIRAIASRDKPPSEILARLNDAILRQRSDGRFCTVAYAVLTLTGAGARIEFANGGHPLPLVARAAGRAEFAGRPGTLLGVVPDPSLPDHAIELEPGDTFVLYTDGITEAGAPDHLLGPDDLADVIAGCDTQEAADVASCMEGAAVEASGGEPHDDIAIVVLHVPAAHAERRPGELRVSAPAGLG